MLLWLLFIGQWNIGAFRMDFGITTSWFPERCINCITIIHWIYQILLFLVNEWAKSFGLNFGSPPQSNLGVQSFMGEIIWERGLPQNGPMKTHTPACAQIRDPQDIGGVPIINELCHLNCVANASERKRLCQIIQPDLGWDLLTKTADRWSRWAIKRHNREP